MLQDIYVLRVWHERGHSEVWRVTVTDTRSQEKFHFATQEALFRFFRERLEFARSSTNLTQKP
jgi:hypothetical protein